jgi:hypothetical protein
LELGMGADTGAAVGAFGWPGFSGAIPGRATPMIVFWPEWIRGCVPAPGGIGGWGVGGRWPAAGGVGGGGGVGYFPTGARAGAGAEG